MRSTPRLSQCASCGGFLPAGSSSCVHCKRDARPLFERFRVVGAVGGTLGASALGFTLMACYGGACVGEGSKCSDGPYYRTDAGDNAEDARTYNPADAEVETPDDDAGGDAGADASDADASDADAGDGGA